MSVECAPVAKPAALGPLLAPREPDADLHVLKIGTVRLDWLQDSATTTPQGQKGSPLPDELRRLSGCRPPAVFSSTSVAAADGTSSGAGAPWHRSQYFPRLRHEDVEATAQEAQKLVRDVYASYENPNTVGFLYPFYVNDDGRQVLLKDHTKIEFIHQKERRRTEKEGQEREDGAAVWGNVQTLLDDGEGDPVALPHWTRSVTSSSPSSCRERGTRRAAADGRSPSVECDAHGEEEAVSTNTPEVSSGTDPTAALEERVMRLLEEEEEEERVMRLLEEEERRRHRDAVKAPKETAALPCWDPSWSSWRYQRRVRADPAVGILHVGANREAEGGGGKGSIVEQREVYQSREGPYYRCHTGNRVYVIDTSKIQYYRE